jgi:hypothetical protein
MDSSLIYFCNLKNKTKQNIKKMDSSLIYFCTLKMDSYFNRIRWLLTTVWVDPPASKTYVRLEISHNHCKTLKSPIKVSEWRFGEEWLDRKSIPDWMIGWRSIDSEEDQSIESSFSIYRNFVPNSVKSDEGEWYDGLVQWENFVCGRYLWTSKLTKVDLRRGFWMHMMSENCPLQSGNPFALPSSQCVQWKERSSHGSLHLVSSWSSSRRSHKIKMKGDYHWEETLSFARKSQFCEF